MKYFANILANILPFVTILYGMVMSILSMRGDLKDPQSHILSLVTFIAATLLSERIFVTSDIRDKINNIDIELSKITEFSEVITFKTEDDAVNYIDGKTTSATNSVWRASLDDQRERNYTRSRVEYWKNREEKIFQDKINYRYVTILYKNTGIDKLNRYNKYVNDKKLTKFYGRFYIASPSHIPLVSFIIIDENEVFTRSPVTPGRSDEYIVIRNRNIVELFKRYYNDLFQHGRSIRGDDFEKLKTEFCSTHNIKETK